MPCYWLTSLLLLIRTSDHFWLAYPWREHIAKYTHIFFPVCTLHFELLIISSFSFLSVGSVRNKIMSSSIRGGLWGLAKFPWICFPPALQCSLSVIQNPICKQRKKGKGSLEKLQKLLRDTGNGEMEPVPETATLYYRCRHQTDCWERKGGYGEPSAIT